MDSKKNKKKVPFSVSQVSIWIASFESPINTGRKWVVSNESEVSSLKSMFDKNNNQN